MPTPRGGIIGARPTWTTTATSGIWTLRQAEEMQAAGQWPRGPVAPTSLAGTGADTEVALTWVAPATTHGTITDYAVEYTPSGGSPTVVLTGSTAASYTVTGLANDTEYTFRVAAINHTQGEWSGTATATPNSGPSDPDFASVALLLHMDGSNGSTTFTDSSQNSFAATASGNVQLSTAESKFGTASALFDGTDDVLSFASNAVFNFGTGDFTVEAWVYLNNVNKEQAVAAKWGSGGAEWLFRLETNNRLKLFAGSSSVTGSSGLSASTWHHVAVARSSGTAKVFLDGVENGSATITDNLTGTTAVTVGAYDPFGTEFLNDFDGYIDDLRITNGVARYTANFTPPTAPFPNQ